ncbi:MAG: PHB depolymerase family esterase [Dehalococcoidia bacterium]
MNIKRLSCSALLLLALLFSLLNSNCIPFRNHSLNQTAPVDSTPAKYNYSSSIYSGGLQRTYNVHVGSSYDKARPTPLLIILHGGGGTGQGMPKLTNFDTIADRENFIIVYPDGFEKHWNDGRGLSQYSAQTQNVDDVGFISALIDHLSDELNIDAKRVYVTGISNGGMMSHRLGCELSQKIAAIAPVASNIPVNMASVWAPSRPVPVLIINGTDDPLERWEGGEIRLGRNTFGIVLSVSDTVKFWVEKDQCSPSLTITQLPDKDPSDGTTVRKEVYGGCENGAEVVLYAVEGGGHTWPGGLQYLPESIIGRTSRDFDASEVIWQFFKEQPIK